MAEPLADPALVRRRQVLAVTAAVAAVMVAVLYVVFVRTRWGQEVDDLAFEGRAAVKPASTRRTDRLLGTVTVESLFVFGGLIVLTAVLRRRLRLAITVGAAMSCAVVTTEILKLELLTRPLFGDVQGIGHNSYPSGHATIAMVLSLGIVTVTPRRRRWIAAIVASVVSAAFGTAVLASGWHRPSDTLGAYAVALAWFAGAIAVVTIRRARRANRDEHDDLEGRLTPRTLLLAGAVVLAFLVVALWQSIEADGLNSVDYAGRYVVACIIINALGIAVVGWYFFLVRDLLLDVDPDPHPA
jgi:membrane-associated phospholipid phosphatase